jgi:hypothetical protein
MFVLALLSPAAVGLAEAELNAALRGEVALRTETFTTATGQSAGRGVGAIVIDRSVPEVWAVVSRYEDKAEYQPRLKTVTVLERQLGRLRVKMEIDAALMTARYTGWFSLDDAAHTIHWSLDRAATDNNIRDVDGEYRLFEVSRSRTLLVYRTFVDTGRSVPKWIQDFMTRKSIPNLLGAIKKRVESGGTYRK